MKNITLFILLSILFTACSQSVCVTKHKAQDKAIHNATGKQLAKNNYHVKIKR